jgi:hypothetical protein
MRTAALGVAFSAGVVIAGESESIPEAGFSGTGFSLNWYSMDSSGGLSTGTGFSVLGVIGQPDAGTMTATVGETTYTLAGGFLGSSAASAVPCEGDVTGDGQVNLADLNLVLANFGATTSDGDANGDGVVNLADLNLVLANFGTNCN